MYKRVRILIITAISAIMMASCSCGEKYDYSVSDLEISYSVPMIAGPNTNHLPPTIALDLQEILDTNDTEGMRIDKARLKTATVFPNDSLGFSNINAFMLSFASFNESVLMVEAAVKNPIEQGVDSVRLDISEEADLGEIMQERGLFVVLDADGIEDYWDGDRYFKINLEFELTIK